MPARFVRADEAGIDQKALSLAPHEPRTQSEGKRVRFRSAAPGCETRPQSRRINPLTQRVCFLLGSAARGRRELRGVFQNRLRASSISEEEKASNSGDAWGVGSASALTERRDQLSYLGVNGLAARVLQGVGNRREQELTKSAAQPKNRHPCRVDSPAEFAGSGFV